ncbi:MAG: hypothetical protein ABR507_10840 [Actinomycetota bacterium]
MRRLRSAWHWVVIFTVPVLLTHPLAFRMGKGLFAWNVPPFPSSGIVPGDHYNNMYRFWLWYDGLTKGRLPLHDPYAFALGGGANDPPFGWIFGPPFAIARSLFGAITAYNLLVLAALLCTGVFTYLWLRRLGLPKTACVIGAAAAMTMPAAYARLTVHIKAFFLWLMPASLYAIERSNGKRHGTSWALAAGLLAFCLVTVIEPETGVYFWPLLILYSIGTLSRRRWFALSVGLLLSGLYLLFFYQRVIGPSVTKAGRSIDSLMNYSPTLSDLFRRTYNPVLLERYVYAGGLSLLALVGIGLIWRSKIPIGKKVYVAMLPLVLLVALGPNAPGIGHVYLWAFRNISAFRVVQTPGRIVFVIAPMIAMGAAYFAKVIRGRWSIPVALIIVSLATFDSRAVSFAQSPPLDPLIFSKARSATAVLDLPITTGIDFHASVYNYETTILPAPRAGGVSPFVTMEAIRAFNRVGDIGAGNISPRVLDAACEMKISHVVVWRDMFGLPQLPPDVRPALAALDSSPRFRLVGAGQGLYVYALKC